MRKKAKKSGYERMLEREIGSLQKKISELKEKPVLLREKEFHQIPPEKTLQILEEIKVPPIEFIQEDKKKKKSAEQEESASA